MTLLAEAGIEPAGGFPPRDFKVRTRQRQSRFSPLLSSILQTRGTRRGTTKFTSNILRRRRVYLVEVCPTVVWGRVRVQTLDGRVLSQRCRRASRICPSVRAPFDTRTLTNRNLAPLAWRAAARSWPVPRS